METYRYNNKDSPVQNLSKSKKTTLLIELLDQSIPMLIKLDVFSVKSHLQNSSIVAKVYKDLKELPHVAWFDFEEGLSNQKVHEFRKECEGWTAVFDFDFDFFPPHMIFFSFDGPSSPPPQIALIAGTCFSIRIRFGVLGSRFSSSAIIAGSEELSTAIIARVSYFSVRSVDSVFSCKRRCRERERDFRNKSPFLAN